MADPRIPQILIATEQLLPFASEDVGWLVRDLDIAALARVGESRHPWLAVDLDSVEGLNADAAGVRFAVRTVGVDAVASRRPAVALQAAQHGCLGLVRVFAFDSTGLRRSLEAIPSDAGIGLVVSPGIVLPHIERRQRSQLPRPLVAYGLIETADQARLLLAEADTVIVRPEVAAQIRLAGPTLAAEPVSQKQSA